MRYLTVYDDLGARYSIKTSEMLITQKQINGNNEIQKIKSKNIPRIVYL